MRVRCLVGLAAAGVAALPASAAAATARLELSAPARVAAGEAFRVDVRAPAGVRVGAFAASVGYAHGAASISAALPLVRGGFPVGGEGGRVGFYGASGVAPGSGRVGVISFEPSRSGVFRIRIARATLYDPAGRVVARVRPTTLTVRVGTDATVLGGRAPSLVEGSGAAGPLLAAAGAPSSSDGRAGIAAAFFARGQVGMGEVQALVARAASLPTVTRRLSATTATWTVTTTADLADAAPGNGICATAAGSCSLRAAVTEANAHVGPDLIAFNVAPTSGGFAVFQLTTGGPLALTDSTGGTTIDGYTEPGSSPNTDGTLSNARNLIYLDSAGSAGGAYNPRFVLTGGANVFRGLAFSTRGTAIDVEAGGNRNRIVGNWFGFTTTGANMGSGDLAIVLDSTSGNVIGLPTAADRNVFGNFSRATHSEGYTTTNTVQNNLVGITPAGAPSTIGCAGFDWNSGAHSNQIGGLAANQGNHFAHTGCTGIELSHGYTGSGAAPGGDDRWNNEYNTIQGNTFGLDAFGRYAGGAYLSAGSNDDQASLHVPDTLYKADCLNIYDHSPSNLVEGNRCMPRRAGFSTGLVSTHETFRGNVIGVDSAGAAPRTYDFGIVLRRSAQFDAVTGNTIAGAAVGVTVQSVGAYSNTIQGNHYSAIGNLLIDLDNGSGVLGTPLPNDPGDADTGANRKQNFPPVTQLSTSSISGTSSSYGATVEVYQQNAQTGSIDPVAVTTVPTSGVWAISGLGLTPGQRIWAAQTSTLGDTSEAPLAGVVPPAPVPLAGSNPPSARAVAPPSPQAIAVATAALKKALAGSCPRFTIRLLLKRHVCSAIFRAPAAGRITITWTIRTVSATRRHVVRNVGIARGAHAVRRAGKVLVGVRLSSDGRTLLRRAHRSVIVTKRASFRNAAGNVFSRSQRVRLRR